MPLLKSIKDKQSTTRYKSGNEDQRLLTASARNAKEKEFFEQKKKREAERKAAQERIKKAQAAIASRSSNAGVGSSVNSGKGNSPVTRAAMNAPSESDDVNRAGDGGHNRAKESDSRGQRFNDSAQRSSAIPASSLSNELHDTKDNTEVKEDTRTYNPWDDILWREEQDALVYEDMETKGTYVNPIKSKKFQNGLFNSPEEVAYVFGMKYNQQSISEDKEYGANILAVENNGKTKYTYDRAYKGSDNSIINMAVADYLNRALLALSPVNAEATPVGSVHTHSAWEWDGNNFFSKQDDFWLLGETYMVAPDGTLHYLQGEETSYNYTWPAEDLVNKEKMKYGEIVRWGLPSDPNITPYKP